MVPVDIATAEEADVEQEELLKFQEVLRCRRVLIFRIVHVQGPVSRDVGM